MHDEFTAKHQLVLHFWIVELRKCLVFVDKPLDGNASF